MDCKRANNHIRAMIHKELSHEKQTQLKQHLLTCEQCSREASRLTKIWELLLELPAEKRVPNLIPEVLERIAEEEAKSLSDSILEWVTVFRTSFVTAAACAMLVSFIIGAGITGLLPAHYRQATAREDSLFLDELSDVPAASLTSAYISLILEEEEES